MTALNFAAGELRPVVDLRPVVEFTVRGMPVAKGTARAFIAGGKKLPNGLRVGGHAVLTTEANRLSSPLGAWQAAIADEARKAMGDKPCLQGPIGLLVTFVMPRPKSHFRANGDLRPDAPTFHTNAPDLDKLERAVMDGLTSVVYRDDSQVATKAGRKIYGMATGCRVGVTHPSDELLAFDWAVT